MPRTNSATTHAETPTPTQQAPRPYTTRCALESCNRKIHRPERFQHCSPVCSMLERLLNDIAELCPHLEPTQAGQLWAEAVDTADAITRLQNTKSKLWRQVKHDQQAATN